LRAVVIYKVSRTQKEQREIAHRNTRGRRSALDRRNPDGVRIQDGVSSGHGRDLNTRNRVDGDGTTSAAFAGAVAAASHTQHRDQNSNQDANQQGADEVDDSVQRFQCENIFTQGRSAIV